jgi:hypothetical protein
MFFTDDARKRLNTVKAGCHIEEQGDAFKHIWTRVSVKDEVKDSWRDVKNIDIICPGRYTLVCVLSVRVFAQFSPRNHQQCTVKCLL